jgi:hypothetical protein
MQEYPRPRLSERSTAGERVDGRNGYNVRDYMTPWRTIQFQVRRRRLRSFLPRILRAFDRRAPERAELTRQPYLRGVPKRAVGRVVALVTGGCAGGVEIASLAMCTAGKR